jgi:hypothetical protein
MPRRFLKYTFLIQLSLLIVGCFNTDTGMKEENRHTLKVIIEK